MKLLKKSLKEIFSTHKNSNELTNMNINDISEIVKIFILGIIPKIFMKIFIMIFI